MSKGKRMVAVGSNEPMRLIEYLKANRLLQQDKIDLNELDPDRELNLYRGQNGCYLLTSLEGDNE